MKSTATTIEKPKPGTKIPSKAVQMPSESRAPRRARTVQTPSESRASRRARTVQTPSESRSAADANAEPQTVPNSATAPVASRAITMIESPPSIRRELIRPHVIDVYALPNYAADQRADTGAMRELRGQLPGVCDLGIEIMARWGSGHYWLIERNAQNQVGRQTHFYLPALPQPATEAAVTDEDLVEDYEEFIEDDDLELIEQENFQLKLQLARLKERDRIRAEMPPQAAPAAPSLKEQLDLLLKLDELRGRGGAQTPPPPPPKSLIEQLQELKQAEAILAPKRENPPPPPIQPEAPADPRVTVLQMLLDDPDSAKGMASKLRGLFSGETELPPEPQTSFWDFAMSAMDSLAPVLPVLAQRFLGNVNGPAVEVVEAGQSNPQGIQPPPATPASKPAQPQRMTPDEHFSRASQIVIDGMMNNARQQEAADALKSVIDRNRTYAPTVIELVKLSPGEVIEQLKPLWAGQPGMADKLNAPHVIPWLADVLDRVRNAAGIEPGEAPDDEDGSAGSET